MGAIPCRIWKKLTFSDRLLTLLRTLSVNLNNFKASIWILQKYLAIFSEKLLDNPKNLCESEPLAICLKRASMKISLLKLEKSNFIFSGKLRLASNNHMCQYERVASRLRKRVGTFLCRLWKNLYFDPPKNLDNFMFAGRLLDAPKNVLCD